MKRFYTSKIRRNYRNFTRYLTSLLQVSFQIKDRLCEVVFGRLNVELRRKLKIYIDIDRYFSKYSLERRSLEVVDTITAVCRF